WLMSRRRNSRVFQNRSVDEIVRAVLAEHQIPSHWVLDGHHPPREYCTQYEETDRELMTRLLAEAGIFFFFKQPDGVVGEIVERLDGDVMAVVGGAVDALGGAVNAVGDAAHAVGGAMDAIGGGKGIGEVVGEVGQILGDLVGTGSPR